MGKIDERQLPVRQQVADVAGVGGGSGSFFFCDRCSRQFNFKCVALLLLSFTAFVSAVFWVLPLRSKLSGFDANQFIKHSASVQAYFKLQKPVAELIPQIARLEYDISGEIHVPNTKVVLLSMHQAGTSNWTDVVFGFLSNPMNASISPVSLTVLKSSLVELFFQWPNFTLTNSIFGQPSSFEILKFPGGITIIPQNSAPVWPTSQFLFNFTLNNSIFEINENYIALKEQLKLGLHLWPHENVHVQVTNKNGSTRDPPVIVDASVTSDYGNLPPQRLNQLAQIITRSPPGKNLGLSNPVFGKVKEVSLSSYLNHSIHAAPPSPAPAPSPMQNDYPGPSISLSPSLSPSSSPSPSPSFPYLPPCAGCGIFAPSGGGLPPSPEGKPPQSWPPTSNSPAPVTSHCGSQHPPSPSSSPLAPNLPPKASHSPPFYGPTSGRTPGPSPLPSRGPDKGTGGPPPVFASISPSQLSNAVGSFNTEMWWFCLCGFWMFYLLCSMF